MKGIITPAWPNNERGTPTTVVDNIRVYKVNEKDRGVGKQDGDSRQGEYHCTGNTEHVQRRGEETMEGLRWQKTNQGVREDKYTTRSRAVLET